MQVMMRAEDAAQHDRYLHNFKNKGTSETAVNRLRRIARRKNGLEFPINLTVRDQQSAPQSCRARIVTLAFF